MADRRPPAFESVTEITADRHGTRAPARRTAELRWNDSDGAHGVAITSRVVVGSAARADLVLRDPALSRLHAELEPREDGVWVRDLGSTNGTFVDGMRVTGACLPDGATLRVGGTEFAIAYASARAVADLWPDEHFGPLIGRSAAMRELFARLARVAPSESTVLIQGETGTGKELVARAIHEASARANGPFVVIDCAALPESLLDAELFGHARGAFTGAVAARAGAIESAHGGTVFLDEVGELPLATQPRLLRALESRTVRRVGETQHRAVDVRFVTATHRDLRTMVNAGAFREDLYFRLAVVPVLVPPLRSRRDDVPALVAHFLARFHAAAALPPELLRELARHPWMGNVRELRNVVERAVTLGPREALALLGNEAAAAEPPRVPVGRGAEPERASLAPPPPPSPALAADGIVPAELLEAPFKEARERWLDQLEREYIAALLARHGRNVVAAAQAAGVDRSYVHRLIRRHAL